MSKKSSNANNIRQNSQVIGNAFARLRRNEEEIIRRGMYELLEDAVQVALDLHDPKHQAHIEIGDTYGWVLIHNGQIEELAVVSTPQNEGRATEQLQDIVGKVRSTGWVGVVMAGLEPANYFSVTYESNLLQYTFQEIKRDFFKYFTAI